MLIERIKLYIKSAYKSKFAKDTIITFASQIIILLTTFIINKIVASRLGVIGYGEFSIAKRTASVIAFVMLMGLGISLPRYIALSKGNGDKSNQDQYILASIILLICFSAVIAILLLLLRNPFSSLIFSKSGYNYAIVPIVVYSFSICITSYFYAYYRGRSLFYMYNISQIFVQMILLIVAIINKNSFEKLLLTWGICTGCFGILVVSYAAYKHYKSYKESEISEKKDRIINKIKELLNFGMPRLVGEFVLFSFYVVPLIIINYKIGLKNASYLSVAVTVMNMFTPFYGFVGYVLLPYVSENIAKKNIEGIERKIKKLLYMYVLSSILFSIGIIIFAPVVVKVFFSKEFLDGVLFTRIVILALIPNSIYLLLRNPIDAASVKPYNTFNLAVSFTVMIVLLVFTKSMIMSAASFVVANLILAGMTFYTWNKCKQTIRQNCMM